MSYRKTCLICVLLISSAAAFAQVYNSEQVQVSPPLVRAIDAPAADASATAVTTTAAIASPAIGEEAPWAVGDRSAIGVAPQALRRLCR